MRGISDFKIWESARRARRGLWVYWSDERNRDGDGGIEKM